MKAKRKREEKRKKREKPRKVRISMIFYFEYGLMCILDFSRDCYGFQT